MAITSRLEISRDPPLLHTALTAMPIHEADPWREQYFRDVACPPHVHIPTDDLLAYELYPRQCWVYNKLRVAESQGLACGTHDAMPSQFPVFSKPVTNLRGMGVGSCIVKDAGDFSQLRNSENFWSSYLTGCHVSTDCAVVHGAPAWWRHARGMPRPGGTFNFWIIEAGGRESLELYCGQWIRENLPDYTGMVNLETVGGRIVEVHLCFSDQWPDLYGDRWTDSVVRLYKQGVWNFKDAERSEGYSVVLFGRHGQLYDHPEKVQLREYRAASGVKSVQITFFPQRPPETHALPPGGFRLAVINCTRLSAGIALRALMAADFALSVAVKRKLPNGPSSTRTAGEAELALRGGVRAS